MTLEHEHSRQQPSRKNAGGADLPGPPSRRPSRGPPPLPRSAPSPAIAGAGSPGAARPSEYPVAVEAFTVDESHYHRSRVVTTLVLVASAALLLIPILAGSQLPVAPNAAAGMPESDTAVIEQFFLLEEVLIRSTNEEGGDDGQERCANELPGVSPPTAAEP